MLTDGFPRGIYDGSAIEPAYRTVHLGDMVVKIFLDILNKNQLNVRYGGLR